jgi:hypothetical protein
MNYELIAKPNHWDKKFTIRLKYKSGIEKYRTHKLTDDDFNTMLNYTTEQWENYLDTQVNYEVV